MSGSLGEGWILGAFYFPVVPTFSALDFLRQLYSPLPRSMMRWDFRRTLFKGRAYFVGTEFVGYAWFSRTKFSAEAFFERTKFHSGARFAGVEFRDIAIFSEAKFERASFLSVKFTETADFSSSWFASNAHFTSCQSDLGFFLIDANFAGEPPNFTQATFKQAPDL